MRPTWRHDSMRMRRAGGSKVLVLKSSSMDGREVRLHGRQLQVISFRLIVAQHLGGIGVTCRYLSTAYAPSAAIWSCRCWRLSIFITADHPRTPSTGGPWQRDIGE